MAEPTERCQECGLYPARYSLDYWHRRFGSWPTYCRECAERLAARVARDGYGGVPNMADEPQGEKQWN